MLFVVLGLLAQCLLISVATENVSFIANFVPNFVAMATGWVGENAIGGIRWPIPENTRIGAKISLKSVMQADL